MNKHKNLQPRKFSQSIGQYFYSYYKINLLSETTVSRGPTGIYLLTLAILTAE